MANDAFGLIGKVVGGQFRVDELVGEGGFSVVYKGFHLGLKEPVAIKCLRLPQLEKKELADQFAHRFRDESRIAYRLSQGNLNIVRSITSGTTNDASGKVVPYMVLEWLNGDTLAADLKRRREQGLRGRSVGEIVQLFATAAEALSYAHGHGVIHRDVKPQNLFLAQTREGVRLKVLDFGMAKILSDGTLGVAPLAQSMGTNAPVFSPPYAAPEQFDWKVGLIGTWTDVYSLAMIIVEALADKRARTGESIAECMVQACDPKRRFRPRDLGMPLGDAVDDVLARALSLKPKERQQDMNEFWSQLNAAHKKDSERGPSIPVSFGTDPPPEEVKTAVTDTRTLFNDTDLGGRFAKRQPHISMPHIEDANAFPSDAPTVNIEQPPQARMPQVPPAPAAPRLDQTIVSAPPVHDGPSPTRTLFGTGPTPRPAAGAVATAGVAPGGAPRPASPLTRTLGLGVAPPPAAVPAPVEPMRPPMPSDEATSVTTVAPSNRDQPMSPDAAAPPVARSAQSHDATEIVASSAFYPGTTPSAEQPSFAQPPQQQQQQQQQQPSVQQPPMMQPPSSLGQTAIMQPGMAAPGYPMHGGMPPQQGYPQTAGYAPLPSGHVQGGYGPPPAASPYGPPPMQAGDGYVNVAPAPAKKPPAILFAILGVGAVLVITLIGVGAWVVTRSRTAAQPPAPSAIIPAATTDTKAVPPPTTATAIATETAPVVTAAPPPEPQPAKTAEPTPAPPPEPATATPPADTKPETRPEPKPEPKPETQSERPRPSGGNVTATPRPTPPPVAAKPAQDPNAFNPDAAKSSLRSMEGILASCKKPDGPTGPGKVKVTFGNSGAVTSAAMIGPPYEGTPVGDCAASRFRMARVSPFEGAPGTVEYGFRINK